MFATILAIIKAIPALKSMVDSFISFYVDSEISTMKKENIEAIKLSIQKHDQRGLEHAIGSPTAGQASGDAGSTITDSKPPNVIDRMP